MKYVQLEPGAFIGDIDFQVMTDRQRGIYLSLILYLYSSGGTLPNTVQTLFKLCSSTLENFEEDWEAIKHKFIVNDTISHKRVDEEIERATVFFNKKRIESKILGFCAAGVHIINTQCLILKIVFELCLCPYHQGYEAEEEDLFHDRDLCRENTKKMAVDPRAKTCRISMRSTH